MSATLRHQAENLAALLPPLLIEAERVAQTVYQGVHGRRRAGVGESFWQFRPYAAGDSIERIDWRQSARTDKVYVREREWEAAQSVNIWADSSGSMNYTSDASRPTKAARARLLMLALASLLLRGGEKVVWLSERHHRAVYGKAGLERIAAIVDENAKGANVPPLMPVARYAHMALCSDFLAVDDALEQRLQHYVAQNLRGVLVHVLDPIEESFAFDGRLDLQGCEGEAPMLVPNAAALRDAYHQRMTEHKDRLLHLAEGAGWHYVRHVTDEAPHLALMRVYQCLTAGSMG